MSKKLFIFTAFLLFGVGSAKAFNPLAQIYNTVVSSSVNVSTITATAINCSGTGVNLPGRYEIKMMNRDSAYSVTIGTSSSVTHGVGYTLSISSFGATAELDLAVSSDITLYGKAQPNAVVGTVIVDCMEMKQ